MYTYAYRTPPPDFISQKDIVSVFVMCGDDMLLLQRHPEKPQGGTRAGPAGKFDAELDMTTIDTAHRELEEETGIVATNSQVSYLGKHFVRYPGFDFTYYKYRLDVDKKPVIRLDPTSHTDYARKIPSEAIHMNLIWGEDEVIKDYFLSPYSKIRK